MHMTLYGLSTFLDLPDLGEDQSELPSDLLVVWALVHGDLDAQIFLHVFGPGGTVQSILALVL